MHVILSDQQSGDKSIMCVERDAQTAIILRADEDRLDQLVRMAASMKVPYVILLVPPQDVGHFQSLGWHVDASLVVLCKEFSKK